MIFVCCDDVIPWESQLVLTLKTPCGFSAAEIALRLFTSEANDYKRLGRSRERLRQEPLELETPPLETLAARLPSVHGILYVLFNEGYLAAHPEHAIRWEVCEEAIRLTTFLAEQPVGAVPETFALIALMHFHVARFGSHRQEFGHPALRETTNRQPRRRRRTPQQQR
jgi:predicted RNA polymerase sigma factor